MHRVSGLLHVRADHKCVSILLEVFAQYRKRKKILIHKSRWCTSNPCTILFCCSSATIKISLAFLSDSCVAVRVADILGWRPTAPLAPPPPPPPPPPPTPLNDETEFRGELRWRLHFEDVRLCKDSCDAFRGVLPKILRPKGKIIRLNKQIKIDES